MDRKEFKWNINKSFSFQISLTLKETIIDTFVRIRLKEGFRCLFQNSQMAVFCIQLSMFDSGEFMCQKSKKESGNENKPTKNETKLEQLNEEDSQCRDEKSQVNFFTETKEISRFLYYF